VAKRTTLPKQLERDVKVEAGHRCAIPSCHQHPIEVAHIEPRKTDGSNGKFDNLIALCANCHTRYDKGEIDRPAMRQYKANLSVLNSRYGDLERRILQSFATQPNANVIIVPGGLSLLWQYLSEDGLVRVVSHTELGRGNVVILGMPAQEYLGITDKGREFIGRWLHAQDLEAT
jgi:hypothetical protein